MLKIVPIYLHRNHGAQDVFTSYHAMPMAHGSGGQGAMGRGMTGGMMDTGSRPPSAMDVLDGRLSPRSQPPGDPAKPPDEHKH